MSTEKSESPDHDLEQDIARAQQNITLLRSQLKASHIEPKYFDERLQEILKTLTKLKSEQLDSKRGKRIEALYEVSKVIGSSLNLQTVLNQVMDAIIQLTQAERGFLMLLDDGKLLVRVARNFDQETLQSEDIAFSRTITRQVFESGEPVVTLNAQEDPRYAGQASVVAHNLRSVMATPLRARGQITGVVYVDNRIRTALFSDDDLAALDAFAAQAAVSLENARLYSETDAELQARVEELQILQWIDRQLNESLDPENTMRLTLEWSSRLCDAQSASMGLIDQQEKIVRLMANYGEPNEFAKTPTMPLTHPLIAQVLETGRAALQLSPPNVDPPKTVLCVPIKLENEINGVVLFSADRKDAFDVDAQALVARMSDRAAIALQNARLYSAVKAADRAKTEFVSVVAHELKVPMTSIRGYASMLGVVGALSDQQKEFVTTIDNNVERMKILVEDLSDISRIESGQLKISIEPLDLSKALALAKDGVMAQIEARNHSLVEEVEPKLPQVQADASRLVQILVNLLSNAYKYTPDGGTITLSAKRNDNVIKIAIKDSGIGMTPEQVAQLGTKFFRADNEHVTQQPGTGLGFAITRNLIELMKGHLEIHSEVGQGSTFEFTLPVSNANATSVKLTETATEK